MADQSHLEAMREAIKGDLERAKARRPSIFERPAPPPVEIRPAPQPAEPEPVVEPAEEPSNNLLRGETGPDTTAQPEPESAVDLAEEPADASQRRPSLLSRLAFWRR